MAARHSGQFAVETKCYQSCAVRIAVCGPYEGSCAMSTVNNAVLTYQYTTQTTSVNMDFAMGVSPKPEKSHSLPFGIQ